MRIKQRVLRMPSRRFWHNLLWALGLSGTAAVLMAFMIADKVIPVVDKWLGTDFESKAGPWGTVFVLLLAFSITTVIQLAKSDAHESEGSAGTLAPGAILGVSIVGFANMEAGTQRHVIDELLRAIEGLIDVNAPRGDNSETAGVKTVGNGLTVYLERSSSECEDRPFVRALALGVHVADMAKQMEPPVNLGLVVHNGDGVVFRQLGTSIEWQGHRWSDTVRLMGLASEGHLLITKKAYTKFDHDFFSNRIKGSTADLLPRLREAKASKQTLRVFEDADRYSLNKEVVCYADRTFEVYNLLLTQRRNGNDERVVLGRATMPPSSVQIEQRHPSTDEANAFVEHLVSSDRVCVIGITHRQLERYLAVALEKRERAGADFWDSLDIVFPSREVLDKMLQEDKSAEQRAEDWRAGRLNVVRFLEGRNRPGQWRCLESARTFSFSGNRFEYADERGVVRICPSLTGDQQQAFYLTYPEGTRFHDMVSTTFDTLLAGSISVSEWDVHGVKEDDLFFYRGIALRPSVEKVGTCVPVVLVVLHGLRAGHKVFLQKRTMFNSSDGHGTYSNISGRIAIEDMFDESGMEQGRQVVRNAWNNHASELEEGRLSTLVSREVSGAFGWNGGTEVPDSAWRRGAAREVQEELGLDIDPSRLLYHQQHYLRLGGDTTADRYFRIYSLELQGDEFDLVLARRPHANLEPMRISEISALEAEDRLNRLLARKFHDIFEPLYQGLGVDR